MARTQQASAAWKNKGNKRQRDDADGTATGPAAKKTKQFNRKHAKPADNQSSDASSSEPQEKAPMTIKQLAASKVVMPALVKQTDDDMTFWELPNSKRRASIQKWKGTVMVAIREFYDDKNSGKKMPGKQGINLPVDQYKSFLRAIPLINAELRAMGEDIDDSVLGGAGAGGDQAQKSKKAKEATKPKKANIEATSESEEEEEEEDDASSPSSSSEEDEEEDEEDDEEE